MLVLAALCGGVAGRAAAADLNQATRAEIEAVRGVGVELADRILAAREAGPYTGWDDLRRRVRGVTPRALAGFAEAGWRLGGAAPPQPAASAPARRSDR